MTSGVAGLYRSVIDDVVNNVREAFLDEGVDEQVLQELKQIWENKLLLSKAVPVEGAQAADHNQHPHTLQTQFAIQTQGHGAANAKRARIQLPPSSFQVVPSASKTAADLRGRGSAAITQHLPAGSVVQPTVQYQYTTGELGEASKTVTITLPQGVGGSQKPVAIALPAIMQQAAAGLVMSSSATAAASALPPNIAAGLLQPSLATLNSGNVFSHQNADGTTVHYQAVTAEQLAKQGYTLNVTQANPQQPSQQVHLNTSGMIQLDGVNDTSDEDEDDEDDKDDDNDIGDDDEQNEDENDAGGEEEEPLNSGDDVSDEDPSELFDTDNVIVCQYDKITRSRNKWKFHLKDGIMNLQGKDFVFQRASGDAEW